MRASKQRVELSPEANRFGVQTAQPCSGSQRCEGSPLTQPSLATLLLSGQSWITQGQSWVRVGQALTSGGICSLHGSCLGEGKTRGGLCASFALESWRGCGFLKEDI